MAEHPGSPAALAAECDRLRMLSLELLAALKQAEIEVAEAADKMHVLGINHPGRINSQTNYLAQDKEFMGELAQRFFASDRMLRAVIAKAEGAAS
jgi:hypothetical protein